MRTRLVPGLPAFTGCDAVSGFAGIVKVKIQAYIRATWRKLVYTWRSPASYIAALLCDIYGAKMEICVVNQYRYTMFCAKKSEADFHQLPLYQVSLKKHSQRANYHAAIWRNSLRNDVVPEEVTSLSYNLIHIT